MGYIKHHSLIVSSWNLEAMEKAHQVVEGILKEYGAPHSNGTAADASALLTPLAPYIVNGGASFAVLPDGSKEGWGDSDNGDAARDRIAEWLDAQAYDDGSNVYDWVELSFPGDVSGDALVTRHGRQIQDRMYEEAQDPA